MSDLATKIIERLVHLYENQTGEEFEYREVNPEETEEHKEKTA